MFIIGSWTKCPWWLPFPHCFHTQTFHSPHLHFSAYRMKAQSMSNHISTHPPKHYHSLTFLPLPPKPLVVFPSPLNLECKCLGFSNLFLLLVLLLLHCLACGCAVPELAKMSVNTELLCPWFKSCLLKVALCKLQFS